MALTKPTRFFNKTDLVDISNFENIILFFNIDTNEISVLIYSNEYGTGIWIAVSLPGTL